MKNTNGFVWLPVLLVLLGVVVIGGGAYYFTTQNPSSQTPVYQEATTTPQVKTQAPAKAITYKTINNADLGISFQVPTDWIIVNHLSDAHQLWAEDPASLSKISDGYGFSVSVGTTTYSNTSGISNFSVLQSQQIGYHTMQKVEGGFDSNYTKVKNLSVDGNPAVLFTASGGKDYLYNYETLWIHGQTRDWYVTFEDSAYPQKYPYEVPIQQAILASIHVTQ